MGKIKSRWDNLDKDIQKWATRLGAIATIIGFLVAGGGWVVNQINDNLATRLESQTADIQAEVQKLSEQVTVNDQQREIQITRLELMYLIQHDPENTVEIEKLARHYFQAGGNSYMSSVYAQYCKSHNADCEVMYR